MMVSQTVRTKNEDLTQKTESHVARPPETGHGKVRGRGTRGENPGPALGRRRTSFLGVVLTLLLCFLGLYYKQGWVVIIAFTMAPLAYCQAYGSFRIIWPYEFNDGLPSATAQITKLFDIAEWRIDIISGSLTPVVYEEAPVREAIERALSRGVQMRIVLAADHVDERFASSDHWTSSNGVSLRHVPGGFRHIYVVDGAHTRIEKNHVKDPEHVKAVCRFEGYRLAEQATDYFESIFETVNDYRPYEQVVR